MDSSGAVFSANRGNASRIWYFVLYQYFGCVWLTTPLGPIVRVTPEEIHIRDADFYNELFVAANVRKTNGYTRYARGTGFEGRFTCACCYSVMDARANWIT